MSSPENPDLFQLFGTNQESEEEGKWFDLTDTMGFKIRAFSAKIVVDLREKLMKPYLNYQRANLEIPKEKNDEIGLRVIAGGVLADWKGVVIDGETVSYSPDAAYTLLKKLPRLANFLASNSMDSSNYREEQRKDSVGN